MTSVAWFLPSPDSSKTELLEWPVLKPSQGSEPDGLTAPEERRHRVRRLARLRRRPSLRERRDVLRMPIVHSSCEVTPKSCREGEDFAEEVSLCPESIHSGLLGEKSRLRLKINQLARAREASIKTLGL